MTPQPIDLKEAQSGQYRFFEAMFVGEKVHIDAFENQHNPVLSKRYSTVRSQDYLLEILPNGASKASGLKIGRPPRYPPRRNHGYGRCQQRPGND